MGMDYAEHAHDGGRGDLHGDLNNNTPSRRYDEPTRRTRPTMLVIVRGERGEEGHFHLTKEANDILERQEHKRDNEHSEPTSTRRGKRERGADLKHKSEFGNHRTKRASLATTAPRASMATTATKGEFGDHRNHKGE